MAIMVHSRSARSLLLQSSTDRRVDGSVRNRPHCSGRTTVFRSLRDRQ